LARFENRKQEKDAHWVDSEFFVGPYHVCQPEQAKEREKDVKLKPKLVSERKGQLVYVSALIIVIASSLDGNLAFFLSGAVSESRH
jgi:hypothetical protein